MASMRDQRRPKSRPSEGASQVASAARAGELSERRAHVERRLRFLASEESRLALAGNFAEACEAARERRYWQFVRALLAAPMGSPAERATVH